MADPGAASVLSLCSGGGGLELGLSLVMPTHVVAFVERDPFAAAVLLARMEDQSLESAPVWCGDLRALDASPFAGVGIITAGFPCQPFSAAGKRKGTDDERWIWPDIAGVVRDVGPRLVFLENVPPLLRPFRRRGRWQRAPVETVLGDLADLGFDAQWGVLGAGDVGAPHIRKRVFILAYRRDMVDAAGGLFGNRSQGDESFEPRRLIVQAVVDPTGPSDMADPLRGRQPTQLGQPSAGGGQPDPAGVGTDVAYPRRHPDRTEVHGGEDGGSHAGRSTSELGRPSHPYVADPGRISGERHGDPRGVEGPPATDGAGLRDAAGDGGQVLADAQDPDGWGRGAVQPGEEGQRWGGLGGGGPGVADAQCRGRDGLHERVEQRHLAADVGGDGDWEAPGASLWPPGPDDAAGWAAVDPSAQPSLRRVADGLASRLDRLRVIGNGVVPLVAAAAFVRLAERAGLMDSEVIA